MEYFCCIWGGGEGNGLFCFIWGWGGGNGLFCLFGDRWGNGLFFLVFFISTLTLKTLIVLRCFFWPGISL